ncbi:hypothetical protein F5Y08DRAFT_182997 [Xylaria arbuscula]|nr:hypothetical protein F5Y08DRAFT_182997 [Xylaria arbuscula]
MSCKHCLPVSTPRRTNDRARGQTAQRFFLILSLSLLYFPLFTKRGNICSILSQLPTNIDFFFHHLMFPFSLGKNTTGEKTVNHKKGNNQAHRRGAQELNVFFFFFLHIFFFWLPHYLSCHVIFPFVLGKMGVAIKTERIGFTRHRHRHRSTHSTKKHKWIGCV